MIVGMLKMTVVQIAILIEIYTNLRFNSYQSPTYYVNYKQHKRLN